ANDFAEAYMADYNRRFGKVPRHDFDVHRAVEHDEDLGLIFTVILTRHFRTAFVS
ncbi:hypothetical protein GTJ48_24025, partial [Enterobacter hormaechei]|nr:hypothetical protein [Enterobacter hormaechei]